MYPTTVQTDVRTIVADETAAPLLISVDPETDLAERGFKVDGFLAKLGLEPDQTADQGLETVADLVTFLSAQPDDVRSSLWQQATAARISRLVKGVVLATRGRPPADPGRRFWYGLVTQILWWYALQDEDTGAQMVQRGMPARAARSLTGLGLVEPEVLVRGERVDQAAFADALVRLDYSGQAALDAYSTLQRIAQNISHRHDGKLQHALRHYADRMVEALSQDLLAGFDAPAFLPRAVRSWVSVSTGLPVSVWSPSTQSFVDKFAASGVSDAMLEGVADGLDLGMLALDDALTRFMEELCRDCEPGNADHQFCGRRFSLIGFQVECVSHPSTGT